jgi:hypothetical protein
VLLYGVASRAWSRVGDRLFGFGGEPWHGYNSNSENVLQIGTIRAREGSPNPGPRP